MTQNFFMWKIKTNNDMLYHRPRRDFETMTYAGLRLMI